MKKPEFAEGYVTFWKGQDGWRASFFTQKPSSGESWAIKIPVPDTLLANQLPNEDMIQVEHKGA